MRCFRCPCAYGYGGEARGGPFGLITACNDLTCPLAFFLNVPAGDEDGSAERVCVHGGPAEP